MTIYLEEHHIAYNLIPHLRNQDVVQVESEPFPGSLVVSMVDGYSNPDKIKGDEAGRAIADFVSKLFPQVFLQNEEKSFLLRAKKTARVVDEKVLSIYPKYVACVGVFLFQRGKKQIIVTVGSVVLYVWNGKKWHKPKEIGNYSLDPRQYGSDVSRFFGGGDNKNKPLFSCEPDAIYINSSIPVFLATDGFEDIFDLKRLNNFTLRLDNLNPKSFIDSLTLKIKNSKKQKDDCSILLKGRL